MADKRMFTKKVTDDDHFMELSASAQALYLHLCMSADDDGFCNQISISMFKAHASVGDLEALLEKRYLLQFDDGVIVIKHWRMANAIRKDRYTPTAFQEDLAKLQIKDNGSYTLVDTWLPDGCQVVAERLPQDRLDKDRVGKDSIEENIDGRSAPSDLDSAMKEFEKFRKAMKKPMTDRARDLILKDLQKFAPDDIETQIAIINQSIKRGWVGVFPLKDDAPKQEPQKQENRNFKVSTDPEKWNTPRRKQAVEDLLNGR